MKTRLLILRNYYCLLYNGPSVQTEMLKLLYRMLFMRNVLFSHRSKYHNAMLVIMVADYYSAHMKGLYSFLVVQNRIADLRHPQFEVREMNLFPLNMRRFHEMNPSLSQRF